MNKLNWWWHLLILFSLYSSSVFSILSFYCLFFHSFFFSYLSSRLPLPFFFFYLHAHISLSQPLLHVFILGWTTKVLVLVFLNVQSKLMLKDFLSKMHPLSTSPSGYERMYWMCIEFKDTDSCKLAVECFCFKFSHSVRVCVCPLNDPGLGIVLPHCLWMSHLHKNANGEV